MEAENEESLSPGAKAAVIAADFALGIGLFPLVGVSLALFWAWFVLPNFPTAPELPWTTCVGLLLLTRIVRGVSLNKLDEEIAPAMKSLRKTSLLVAAHSVVLLIGYCLHKLET